MNARPSVARRLIAALLVGSAFGSAVRAQDRCRVPDVVVPIANVHGVFAACETEVVHRSPSAFDAIDNLLITNVCAAEYKNATRVRRELDCVGAKLNFASALARQATGEVLEAFEAQTTDRTQCSAALKRMEQAWHAGEHKRTAEYLYMTAFQGSFRGLCGKRDLRAAARYLVAGAAAGDPFSQGKLAQTLLAERFPKMFEADNAFFPPQPPYLIDFIDAKTRAMTGDQILNLLTQAGNAWDGLAQHLLVRVHQKGLLGEVRPDLALAWAAQGSVMEADDSEDPDKDGVRYGFTDLHESASDETKAAACRTLRDWSAHNINFRIYPESLKNAFARACFDPVAIADDEPCLEHADVADVERRLAPLLQRYPQCRQKQP